MRGLPDALASWLIEVAPGLGGGAELVSGLFDRLREQGLPLTRLVVGVRVLHPLVRDVTWRVGRGEQAIEARAYGHDIEASPAYVESPVRALHQGLAELHRPLVGAGARLDYPVLSELAAEGATAWFGLGFRFSSGAPNAATFTTDAPGGFSAEGLDLLRALRPLLALVLEVHVQRLIAGTLLGTYLGRDAGRRVLQGHVRLGDSEVIPAVIWFSDMRGFTARSERLSREDLLLALDAMFERQVGPVHEAGGEVLKFMGDGLMAIFRVDALGGEARACAAALDAAAEANARLARWSGVGAPLEIGLALHLGEVVFGNMGAPDRMDFTVIGEAVNIASRIERLCKTLRRRVLVSREVAEAVGTSRALEPLGAWPVPGFTIPLEVFSPLEIFSPSVEVIQESNDPGPLG